MPDIPAIFMHNLKMYNLTRDNSGYDAIGSMIGTATQISLLTYNSTDTKGYTKILAGPPYREPACVDRI